MSSSVDVRPRSDIWSYFSLSPTPRNRRSSSVTLPTSRSSPAGCSSGGGANGSSNRGTSSYTAAAANGGGPYSRVAATTVAEKADAAVRRVSLAAAGGAWDSSASGGGGGGIMAMFFSRRQRARYLRVGAVVACLLLVLFFLTPGERRKVEKYVGEHAPFRSGGEVASDPSVGTARCSKSVAAHKPVVQYVLMIDAGSTGSRIHVYRFNNCGATPELEDEVFKMTPVLKGGSGLSAYKADAEEAAKSLDVLMDVALEHVPDKLKGCTPVAVKATAGLRALGPDTSEQILKAVRHRLETKYPFPVVSEEKGGVEVMDGKYEAVYAWITTNYLLGKIGGPDDSPTAAVFDLGGGSTQIVFEPNFKTAGGGMPKHLEAGDHKYDLQFGGRHFSLYQHSYLGYGLMAARKGIHARVIEAVHKEKGDDVSWLSQPIVNPCIIPGMSEEVEVDMPQGHALGEKLKVQMVGPKEGAAVQCQGIAERTLRKDAECKLHPCAFDGVHQPSLEKTFAREDVYLFSYFYDRIKPLGVPESFTLRELKELAHRVCQGKSAWDVFEGVEGAMQELNGRPQSCLDLNFMVALLHLGYEMPIDREVKMAKKIKNNELGWCLGARYVISFLGLLLTDAVYRYSRMVLAGNVKYMK